MRVLHFVPYFPPERLGGVGEFVAGLHEGLLGKGHVSTVVTTGRRSGAGVHRIARRPLVWFFKTSLWARRGRTYDVVHLQAGEALPVLLALRLLRLLLGGGPKVLTTFHVSFVGISASFRPYALGGRTFADETRALVYRTLVSWLHRVLDRVTIILSDQVNTISRQSRAEVLGSDDDQLHPVIYYGLADLDEGDDGSVATGSVVPSPVELLYAGSGGHRKRVAALSFVLQEVRRSVPDARLRIVGFTPQSEPRVAALLAELGLTEHVDFAGVKTSAQLPEFYARARVLVVPSAYEGLPFVILEAMRSGLPVVATRVSGHPEAIEDGVNGFLVDLDDPEQLAQRCVELLQDDGLAERLGRAARETFLQRFDIDRQLRRYIEIYQCLRGH